MQEKNIDELLDQFLAGKLTEEELKWRHEQLKKGNLTAISEKEIDEVVLPNELLSSLNFKTESSEIPFKTFQSIESKPVITRQKITWITWLKRQTWLSALAVISILLLPIIYLFSWINNDKQQLIQEYFVPYDIAHIGRNFNNKTTESYWIDAKTKYEQGNYETAIKLFRKINLAQRKDSYIDAFFIGVCQLGRRYALPHKAVEAFEQEKLNHTDLFLPAQWYLALAHLQSGEKEKAKANLEFLSRQENGYKQQEAKKLIEML